MKMRRLEIAVLTITLAFAFFMGGFFTGRGISAGNLTATTISTSTVSSQGAENTRGSLPPEETQTPSGSGTAIGTAPQAQQGQENGSSQAQNAGEPKAGDGRININTATHGELTDLPGIGKALATRIIDYRTKNGAFAVIEDIRKVSGIGERRFEAIKDLITAGG